MIRGACSGFGHIHSYQCWRNELCFHYHLLAPPPTLPGCRQPRPSVLAPVLESMDSTTFNGITVASDTSFFQLRVSPSYNPPPRIISVLFHSHHHHSQQPGPAVRTRNPPAAFLRPIRLGPPPRQSNSRRSLQPADWGCQTRSRSPQRVPASDPTCPESVIVGHSVTVRGSELRLA